MEVFHQIVHPETEPPLGLQTSQRVSHFGRFLASRPPLSSSLCMATAHTEVAIGGSFCPSSCRRIRPRGSDAP